MDTKKETGKETVMGSIFYYIAIGIMLSVYCVMGFSLQLYDTIKQAITNIERDINVL
jgi:hypothetical protein